MTRAIPIERLPAIDDTEKDILRVISLKLGAEQEGYVDYNIIAKSLNRSRKCVASAVNRMVSKGILRRANGKLSIPIAILV